MSADQNLLFGVIALQADFIDRDALVDAMQQWVTKKDRTLIEILLEMEKLNEREAELLENLAKAQMQRVGGDAGKSLAALSSIGSVREILDDIQDDDVCKSLASYAPRNEPVASIPFETQAPFQTQPPVSSSDFSRFRILRTHARGGLGQVSVAEDQELHRNVALKEILGKYADEIGYRERFVVEAEITGRLQHPGIVPVYGLGTYPDGRPFYAMRFVEGDNLLTAIQHFHHLADSQPWRGEHMVRFRELLGRFCDVCDAMAFAHGRHVLHRDLKPRNIMLGGYGETLVVDWGLAKPLCEGHPTSDIPEDAIVPQSGSASGDDREGSILGSPQYMPPEQAAGKLSQLSQASDIYSLGATLYHLLTNRPPFRADESREDLQSQDEIDEVLNQVRAGLFDPPRKVDSRVPKGLSAICVRAMQKSPEDRYASAQELKLDIQRWLADEPVTALPESWIERSGRWFRNHKTIALTTGASIVSVSMLIAISTLLIGEVRLARLKFEKGNLLANNLDGVIKGREAAKLPFDESFFREEFDVTLKELEELNAERAVKVERNAVEIAADDIENRLKRARLQSDFERLEQRIDDWSARYQTYAIKRNSQDKQDKSLDGRESQLRELLERRNTAWSEALVYADEKLRTATGMQDSRIAQLENGILLARAAKYQFVEVTAKELPKDRDQQITVVFPPEAFEAPVLALGMSPQTTNPDSSQYQVVICSERSVAGRTRSYRRQPKLKEAIAEGRAVHMVLCRGRLPLTSKSVILGPKGTQLSFKREDSTLRASVLTAAGTTENLEFRDFLTLPLRNRPGIWIGPGIAIESMSLAFRPPPGSPTAQERAKELIALGNFDEALSVLNSLTDRYSEYLRSRCYGGDERLTILNGLLATTPNIDSNGIVTDEWYLPAVLDAIELNIVNPERFRELIKTKLAFNFRRSLNDIANRIPEQLRDLLLNEYRKLGGRWRVTTSTENDVEEIELAVALDTLLETDAVISRSTRWRRSDVLRVAGRMDESKTQLRKLIDEALEDPGREPGEVANLIDDLCWVMFAQNDLRGVDRFLADAETLPELTDAARVSIGVQRARYLARSDSPENALAMLTELVEDESSMRIVQYAEACRLAGFIEWDRDEHEKARDWWRRGREFKGQEISLAVSNAGGLQGTQMVELSLLIDADGSMGSLLDAMSIEDTKAAVDALVPEGSVFTSVGRTVLSSGFDVELLNKLSNKVYQSDEGFEVARRSAYRQSTLAEYFNDPTKLLILEAIIVNGFEEHRGNLALIEDARAACNALFDMYDQGKISDQQDFRRLVSLWSGQASLADWAAIESKLPGNLAVGLALVSGRAWMLKTQTKDPDQPSSVTESEAKFQRERAIPLLRKAIEHPADPEATDSFREMAASFLEELQQ